MDSIVASAIIVSAIGVVSVIVGGRIGAAAVAGAAHVAADSADKDRAAAHSARLSDRMIVLASDAIARAERHRMEIWDQSRGWSRAALGADVPDSIPDVHRIDEVVDAVGGLYIVADQGTADAGWRMYLSLREGLDRCVYDAERDRRGDGARTRTAEEIRALSGADRVYQARKTDLINAVRTELGLPHLAPTTTPFPDTELAAKAEVSLTRSVVGNAYTSPPDG